MKERGTLFSGPMVRRLLDGSKTQTRRVIRPQPTFDRDRDQWEWEGKRGIARWGPAHHQPVLSALHYGLLPECPYGVRGDRLWVRETWLSNADLNAIYYQADFQPRYGAWEWDDAPGHTVRVERWRPSIHMPRWASRIKLELTGVRVERLQEITEADAIAEGLESYDCDGVTYWGELNRGHCDPRYAFERLWNDLHPHREDRWLRAGTETTRSPWVWVLELKRVTP